MAGGATGEGEALDYASTVVHALAPTHGSSQVRTYFDNYLAANNIAVRAEGQAGRLNTAFTVGGAPDLESFVADQLAVTRGQANLVQAFRNLARQFGITQNAGGATLAQAVAAATITIPDAALPGLGMDAATPVANKTAVVSGLVRDGWNIAQSTTRWSRPQEGTKSCATKPPSSPSSSVIFPWNPSQIKPISQRFYYKNLFEVSKVSSNHLSHLRCRKTSHHS